MQQSHASALCAMKEGHEKELCSMKERLKKVVSSTLQQKNDSTIFFTGKFPYISVDRDLAFAASPHIRRVMESSMLESQTNEYPIGEYGERVARIMITLIQLGEDHCDEFEWPGLDSSEAYQLMEFITILEIPWACKVIAEHVRQLTTLDLNFLSSASTQYESCLDPFKLSWGSVKDGAEEQVARRIEEFSRDSDFSKIPIPQLNRVIQMVKDEDMPDELPDGGPDNFALRFDGGGRVYLSIASTCRAAFSFPQAKVGDFQYIIQARARPDSAVPPHLIKGQTPYVTHECGPIDVFGASDAWRKAQYSPLQLSFKAAMTRLHRQCLALASYARHAAGPGPAGAPLDAGVCVNAVVEALRFFHCRRDDDGAEPLCALLAQFAARSFALLRDCEAARALPPALLAGVVGRDDLETGRDEAAVLQFVTACAMAARPPADSGGLFQALVAHVRFPHIRPGHHFRLLSQEERAFACAQPALRRLLEEALAAAPAAPESEAARRAAKRARYADPPRVDVPGLLLDAARAAPLPLPRGHGSRREPEGRDQNDQPATSGGGAHVLQGWSRSWGCRRPAAGVGRVWGGGRGALDNITFWPGALRSPSGSRLRTEAGQWPA